MFLAHRQADLAATAQALADHRDHVVFITSDGAVLEFDKTVYGTQDDVMMIMLRPVSAPPMPATDHYPAIDPEFYM